MSATANPASPAAEEEVSDENSLFLDRYRVIKLLGEGSYGRVKLAEDLETNRKVALKIINKTSIKKPEHITRIKREVRIMRLLNHPNIVKLYDVAETDKEIILSMEYIEGGELFDFIVANPRLNEKIARKIFRQIISAVDYCHQSSVIHRDLKPENLLLDNERNIKIIDFGFVNLYDPENVLKTFCGSPFYASPEMILGKKYVGPEVDVWSMGVILFALLAGKLPFRDANVKDLYRKITTSSFELPSCIQKDSGTLITNMLKVNPSERATIEDVKADPWVNVGYNEHPDSFIPPRPFPAEPLNKQALTTMRLYGFEEEAAKKALAAGPTNPAFLLYCLIREHDEAERLGSSNMIKALVIENSPKETSSNKLSIPVPKQSVIRRKSIAAINSTPTAFNANLQPSSYLKLGTVNVGKSADNVNGEDLGKSPMRARKSISTVPSAFNLKKEVQDNPASPSKIEVIVRPILNENIEGSLLPPTNSDTSNSYSTLTSKEETSKQLQITIERPPQDRPRSLSVRYPNKSDNKSTSIMHTRKGSLAPTDNTHLRLSENSMEPASDGSKTPTLGRRLSITNKISNALSKILHMPKSRRGSMSPEQSNQYLAQPRVSKNIYSVDTTSGKKPDDILKELNRVFELNGISSTWTGYKAHCEAPGVKFEIEICGISKTEMHGLELRRKKGTVWTYQAVCSSLISQLKL
ncbi:kinase-like domain-containing protein [Chytriomyces sp. MP71]|nr:kinase-like domain-containing protein [Chytriomyces sp. MP71]